MRPTLTGNALLDMASGHKLARVLQTAVYWGIFDALRDGPLGTAALSHRLGATGDPVERLLATLLALRLVRRRGARWLLSRVARRSLVTGSPRSLVNVIRWLGRNYDAFAQLPWRLRGEARRQRAPVDDKSAREATLTCWISAMHELGASTGAAARLARCLPLDGATSLLDVGAGSGVYGTAIALRHPELRVTLVDTRDVIPMTRRFVPPRLAGRVFVEAADVERAALPGRHEVALLSHVLHLKTEAQALSILRRVHDALVPGGLVVVRGLHLPDQAPSTLEAAMMSLTLALETEGRSYSVSEVSRLLRRAGFVRPRPLDADGVAAGEIILARRPIATRQTARAA